MESRMDAPLLNRGRRLACCFFALALLMPLLAASPANALERLCDSSFENCRTEVLNRIRAEKVEIIIGMWFFEDARFSNETIYRWNAGVQVRVLGDTRSNKDHANNAVILQQMADAGIPIRRRIASGIEHWKLILFVGQNVAYFGSANFNPQAWVPNTPYVDYTDETIYGTDDPSVVNTFKTKFEDVWIDTVAYTNFANAPNSSLARKFPIYPTDSELNFAPVFGSDSYRSRSVRLYDAETQKIDAIMYRITDQAHVDAIIRAFKRGVPVRIYTEPVVYRQSTYIWHSMSVDKMYAAGIPIKMRAHPGQNHQKTVLLYGQRTTVFGSSNWTSSSSDRQHEHNYFTKKPEIFQWFVDQFERKWNNSNPVGGQETKPFVPLPPDAPVYKSPADGAVGVATSGTKLTWYGGPWAHLYDIYFGTSSNPPLFAANQALGPSENTSQNQSFTLPTLTAGTTYYWKIVSKTMAYLSRSGPVRSFTTAGALPPPPPGATTVVLWTSAAPASAIHGDWTRIADPTAAGGAALQNPNRSRTKIAPALASPANYFEMSFQALGGVAYHVWIRMRAEGNSTANDSVHVQFSDSVDASRTAMMRIGTSGSAEPVLQNGPGGETPQGWGWTDNGWGSLGTPVYFANDGAHVIRIQQREDGAVVDQIVLSPTTYLTSSPGARRNDATILGEAGGSSVPPPSSGTVVIWTANLASSLVHGAWSFVSDATAAGSRALRNPNAGASKIVPALASPVSYFEATFSADAGTDYHVWIRGRADGNSFANDSVHVQFDDAVNSSGTAVARIGTTGSLEMVLQAGPSAPAPHGWGWTDNGWGSLGAHVRFAATRVHTIRIQQREDGVTIDQIVISPDAYRTTAPGARRDDATILAAKE
jgi:phosphatidylserine/phosphatidylglycerophosphate/cardiolipin synthase-like enzyme